MLVFCSPDSLFCNVLHTECARHPGLLWVMVGLAYIITDSDQRPFAQISAYSRIVSEVSEALTCERICSTMYLVFRVVRPGGRWFDDMACRFKRNCVVALTTF